VVVMLGSLLWITTGGIPVMPVWHREAIQTCPHVVNLLPSLARGPDPNPNAGRGRASPEGSPLLGVVQLSGRG